MTILSDKTGYRTLDGDPTDVFCCELATIIHSRFDNHLIDQNKFDFLLPTYPRIATFYGPSIVSGVDSLTQNVY